MKPQDGPTLLDSMRSILDFFSKIAQLLQTADEYLTQEKKLTGTTTQRATGETSKSLSQPRQWLPNYLARFFSTEDPHIVAFVSIILVDRPGDKFTIPFTEPLLSAGWIRFEEPTELKGIPWWWGKMACWTNHPRDGSMHHHIATFEQTQEYKYLEQHCLALPLVDFASSELLVEKVLDPLVNSLPSSSF